MPAFFQKLRTRTDKAAAGTAVPAGLDPAAHGDSGGSHVGARESGALRRQLRRLRRRREALLLELGAVVLEADRQSRPDADVVQRKLAEARRINEEERELARSLGRPEGALEVVAAGIAGQCGHCGSLLSTCDRFCAACGTEAGGGRR